MAVVRVRAEEQDDADSRIEALEGKLGSRKGGKGGGVKNMNKQMGSVEDRNRARREAGGAFFASPDSAASPASNTAAAEKKGFLGIPPLKIFTPSPTFDTKSAPAKLWEIWAGDGGVLANINSLATGAAVVMAFAWVLWRVVGPAIGLYELQSGIDSAPNIGIQ